MLLCNLYMDIFNFISILLLLVLIDTILGIAISLKFKTFSLSALLNPIKKIILYIVSISTIRLLELGISTIYDINYIANLMICYLLLFEAISIFKNLSSLGVNLPFNSFLEFFIKKVPFKSEFQTQAEDVAFLVKRIKEDIPVSDPYKEFLDNLLDLYVKSLNNIIILIEDNFESNSTLNLALLNMVNQIKFTTKELILRSEFKNCSMCNMNLSEFSSYLEKKVRFISNSNLSKENLKEYYCEIFSYIIYTIISKYKNI